MFRTLKQALDESPDGMAVIEGHYRQLIKQTDGGYKRVMTGREGVSRPSEGTETDLERIDRLFASENVNCRPISDR